MLCTAFDICLAHLLYTSWGNRRSKK